MFANLSDRLSGILDKIKNRGSLSEDDVNKALREVRIALLEADVALPVVKKFIAEVKEKAVGKDVLQSITPGQMVVKIVSDHLEQMLGDEDASINLNAQPPAVILMLGLQGSGKTTSTAKLANYLRKTLKKDVLMASLDIYRPAAQEQLAVLGRELNIDTLPVVTDQKPVEITKRSLEYARQNGHDVVILDSAGRLHIDHELMSEVKSIKSIAQPVESFLVTDAMTGQDAVTVAESFQKDVGVTGIILTRVDGDARGGAALSMRYVSNCPIKFLGVGEKLDQLELFSPKRISDRILGMGDVVGLVEQAAQSIDREEAEALAIKMKKGGFDLDDMARQLQQMLKMGGISSILNFLPGIGKIKDKINSSGLDDRLIKRQIAIVHSMTGRERRDEKLLNASRKRRIAKGAGVEVSDVNRLLKQFTQMRDMMKKMNKMGKKGIIRRGLGELMSK